MKNITHTHTYMYIYTYNHVYIPDIQHKFNLACEESLCDCHPPTQKKSDGTSGSVQMGLGWGWGWYGALTFRA